MDYEEFWDIAADLAHLGVRHDEGDILGRWENRQPFNTPGPL
jgi:hypothetical protein